MFALYNAMWLRTEEGAWHGKCASRATSELLSISERVCTCVCVCLYVAAGVKETDAVGLRTKFNSILFERY